MACSEPVFAPIDSTGTQPNSSSHIRLARPSRDLARAENFYAQGLGLKVLYRLTPDESHGDGRLGQHVDELLMLGWPGASWHLELVRDHPQAGQAACLPQPTEEDLLVLYLDGPIDQAVLQKLVDAGGKRVTARNPYWEKFGVTVEDPDGYRLVLSQRSWKNE